MHRTGIVGETNGGPADERGELGKSRLARQVRDTGGRRGDLIAAGHLPTRPHQRHAKAILDEVPRHLSEALAQPVLGFPDRAGRDCQQPVADPMPT